MILSVWAEDRHGGRLRGMGHWEGTRSDLSGWTLVIIGNGQKQGCTQTTVRRISGNMDEMWAGSDF
jgi:hypothetical protein